MRSISRFAMVRDGSRWFAMVSAPLLAGVVLARSNLTSSAKPSRVLLRSSATHDFGAVLINAGDSERKFPHWFEFSAEGSTPLLLTYTNPSSCCAAMNLTPETVAPGKSARLRVDLFSPSRTGLVEFAAPVVCEATRQRFHVSLQASLALGVEIAIDRPTEGRWQVAPLEPKTVVGEMIQRVPQGESFPSVYLWGGLDTKNVGFAETSEPPYDVRKQKFAVVLHPPEGDRTCHATLTAKETDGRKYIHDYRLTWVLAPKVKPTSSVVELDSSFGGEVTVESVDGTPFKIVSATAPPWLKCSLPTNAATKQRISIRGTTAADFRFADIDFRVDHPRQKTVRVGVSAVPQEKGAER